MHEIGTLYKIVETVEEIAEANDVRKVKSVTVDLGELTGMLPYFFYEYYPMIVEDHPILKDSVLHLNRVPGEGVCNQCGAHYNIAQCEGKCPCCHSWDKTILSGRELVIRNIEVECTGAVPAPVATPTAD